MDAVTIHDMRPLGDGRVLAVDLIDILRLLEPEVRSLSWTCRNLECMGDAAEEFHSAADAETTLGASELLRLAAGVYQVIDGEFVGSPGAGAPPRLVVVAVDSSYYVVASENPELLDRVRQRFSDVRAAPDEAVEWNEAGM